MLIIIIGANLLPPAAVSPTTIILRPPEKLVIELRTTGGYFFVEWSRNGNQLALPVESFVDFGEIYVKDHTSMSDLGEYRATYALASGQQFSTSEIRVVFFVIAPGTAAFQHFQHINLPFLLQLVPIQPA